MEKSVARGDRCPNAMLFCYIIYTFLSQLKVSGLEDKQFCLFEAE